MQNAEEGTGDPREVPAASGQGAIPDSFDMPQPSVLPDTDDGSVNPLHHTYDSNPDHNSSSDFLFEQSQPCSEAGPWPASASSTDSTGANHEVVRQSVREDAGKQLRCQDRLCTVCKADRESHHQEHAGFPLKVLLCKW